MLAAPGPPTVLLVLLVGRCCASPSAASGLRSTFGEESIVVGAVVAVFGRSLDSADPVIAALEVGGTLPPSSIRLMRDLRSSSSSQTVDGSVSIEAEESAERLGSDVSAGDSSSESCNLAAS